MQDQDGRDTALLILEAARDILEHDGYAALSLRRVAAQVGISQAAMYRHFPDKAALVRNIVAEGLDRLLASIEALPAIAGKEDETLAGGIRAYIAFALERPALFRALLLDDAGPARPGAASLGPGVAVRQRTFRGMAALLRRGMDVGVFRPGDPELTAQAVWMSMFGLAARLVHEIDIAPARREALVERHIEIIIRGLRV